MLLSHRQLFTAVAKLLSEILSLFGPIATTDVVSRLSVCWTHDVLSKNVWTSFERSEKLLTDKSEFWIHVQCMDMHERAATVILVACSTPILRVLITGLDPNKNSTKM